MTRPDVRAAVEAAIRRHLAGSRATPPAEGPAPSARADDPGGSANACRAPGDGVEPAAGSNDLVPGRFPRAVLPGDPPEGRCVIEPGVECVGSGYCRSHGH